MSDGGQVHKTGGKGDQAEADAKDSAPQGDADAQEVVDDVDDLLDEIDDVLEENAEEFVKNYVPEGRGVGPAADRELLHQPRTRAPSGTSPACRDFCRGTG